MALQDHSDLLQALYGMQNSKRLSDRQQFDIWKNAYENRLLSKQIADREKENNQLQSALDKSRKAEADYQEQLNLYNNTMKALQDGSVSNNEWIQLGSLGYDPKLVEQGQNANLLNNVITQFPELEAPLRASGAGVAGSALDTITNSAYLQQSDPRFQGTQDLINVPKVQAQADLTRAQTAAANTLEGKFQAIDGLPATDEQKTIAKLAEAGLSANWAMAIQSLPPDQRNAYILAQAGASDRIQEQAMGLPPEPKSPNALQVNEQEAMIQRRTMVIDALTRAIPGYIPQTDASGNLIMPQMDAETQQRFQTELNKMIASGYTQYNQRTPPAAVGGAKGQLEAQQEIAAIDGLLGQLGVQDPNLRETLIRAAAEKRAGYNPPDPSSGGSSSLQRDTARNLINSLSPAFNRSFTEGESVAYGTTMMLLEFGRMLENARTLEGFDWNMLGYEWTSVLGAVAQKMGTEAGAENPHVATLAQLFANGGQLQNMGYRLAQIASQNNGTLPFEKLPVDIQQEMVKAIAAAQNLTKDPALIEGLKKMVGGEQVYNAILKGLGGRKAAPGVPRPGYIADPNRAPRPRPLSKNDPRYRQGVQ